MYVKTINSIFLIYVYLIIVIFRRLTAGLLCFGRKIPPVAHEASFNLPLDPPDWIIHKDA